MFSKEMEALIEAALQDGVLTDQEKSALVKRAQKEGIDIDELDIYIQSLLQKRHQVQADIDAEKDRQSKMGGIKRCPNCGQVVQGGSAVCTACGFAFNVEGNFNSSAVKLQEELARISEAYRKLIASTSERDNIKRDDLKKQCAMEKKQAIVSVVVANSRVELLELLAYSMPKANKQGNESGFSAWTKAEDLSYAYWILFQNCINLAKVSFSSDPSFAQYFNFYNQEVCKQPKKFWQKPVFWVVIGFICVIILSCILDNVNN